ncbi:MAG: DMT family transporter [Candidatus Thorarchaeota archaeon]
MHLGVAIGFLGAALYALSVVVYRSQKDEIRPIAISSIKMWVAWPFMLFMTILFPGISAVFLPLTTILLLGTSVMFGAVVGDTVYLWSQERIGVSYAFPIAMSFPILTFFLTVAFLGEPLILSRLVGAVIAVLGVIMIPNEQNRKKNHEIESEVVPRNRSRMDLLGIGGAILTMVLYATGTTFLQVAIEGVDPIAGNLVRVSFGRKTWRNVLANSTCDKTCCRCRVLRYGFRITVIRYCSFVFGCRHHVSHRVNCSTVRGPGLCTRVEGESDKTDRCRHPRYYNGCCTRCDRLLIH